jgi:hypothetical protein
MTELADNGVKRVVGERQVLHVAVYQVDLYLGKLRVVGCSFKKFGGKINADDFSSKSPRGDRDTGKVRETKRRNYRDDFLRVQGSPPHLLRELKSEASTKLDQSQVQTSYLQ